jgi:ring-1,2-phenylacetyl-CoA epoxidase subunit PaaB
MKTFIRKFFYGDYGEEKNIATEHNPSRQTINEWPLWEVFIRSKQGLDHKHVGSLHAADATMAMENARDVYTRRNEGISIWIVESKNIHANNPDDADALFDPANDKIYRHPSFYELPDELKHM